jgi:translation elongation factor EF-1beta
VRNSIENFPVATIRTAYTRITYSFSTRLILTSNVCQQYFSYAVLAGGAAPAAPAAKGAAPAKAAGEEAPKSAAADGDMFGDDDDEDGETAEEKAANKARKARMEAARKLKEEADAKAGKVKKAKEVEKSLVVLEIKPWEADTDLEMVWNKIKEYKQEGLTWGATFKLEPVAFGIKKLVMTATIVDSMVLMDDITENIEALEDFVQSVQVASMNKI